MYRLASLIMSELGRANVTYRKETEAFQNIVFTRKKKKHRKEYYIKKDTVVLSLQKEKQDIKKKNYQQVNSYPDLFKTKEINKKSLKQALTVFFSFFFSK